MKKKRIKLMILGLPLVWVITQNAQAKENFYAGDFVKNYRQEIKQKFQKCYRIKELRWKQKCLQKAQENLNKKNRKMQREFLGKLGKRNHLNETIRMRQEKLNELHHNPMHR